jgi:DNA polymerase I
VAVWEPLKEQLIQTVDVDFQVYDGTRFVGQRFADYLDRANIPWPRFPSGALQLDADVFRDQSLTYPQIAPLHQLRQSLAEMRLSGLHVGSDDRNRTLLSPFKSVTGRNQPSNSKFAFGPATWIRGLIKPPPGYGLAYIDWSAQEIAISAALSGDPAMLEAYRSGDPHLGFAKLAGLVPADAMAAQYPKIRAMCKTTNLGVNYGMTAVGLAARLGMLLAEAREILQLHRQTYRRFWQWSDEVCCSAMLHNKLTACFGWSVHITPNSRVRSIQNWPMQANGAEMMRTAAIGATEAGIEVCCPVHDAFLIVAPLSEFDDQVIAMRGIMERAGLAVTGGLTVRTDVKVFRYPDRYVDERGEMMWNLVMQLARTEKIQQERHIGRFGRVAL